MGRVTVEDLTAKEQVEMQLVKVEEPTENGGKLTLSAKRLSLVHEKTLAKTDTVYVAVKLTRAEKLSGITEGPVRVRVTVGGQEQKSKAGCMIRKADLKQIFAAARVLKS